MIHIIDDYVLLAGSAIAILWGTIAIFLAPFMARRTATDDDGFVAAFWLGRNILVLFAGLVVFGVLTSIGTENEASRPLTLLSGLSLISLVLITVPRAYTRMPPAGKIGVLLELLAAILILAGSLL